MAHCDQVPLRRPIFPCHVGEERAAVLVPVGVDLGLTWLGARMPGESMDLIGPLGRGFRLDGPTGHLLLVGCGADVSALLALAHRAVDDGWSVAMLVGFDRADLGVPTALLPPVVEYQMSVGSTALEELGRDLQDALAWADRVCAAGSSALYQLLAQTTREVLLALRPGMAQVLLTPRMACGLGACGACTVQTRRGPRQACRHGPVFDLSELDL
jgi:dihydroorotate dehydrogenase electron transfer subunit